MNPAARSRRPRSIRRRGLRAVLATALSAALLAAVTACVPLAKHDTVLPTQHSTPLASSAPTPDVARFYAQQLTWTDCQGGFQCTTAIAPLDWAKPDGQTITLALIRKPASGQRLGSLFVNPGGPGASAVQFVRSAIGEMDAQLQQHYDIVGVDPRGIGQSSPVSCYDDAGMKNFIYDILPGTRGSDAWLAASEQATTALGAACLKSTGPLLGHVDTASTARDLDMLRAAVGDKTLHYFGFSYGTMIGSVYAGLFPKNVGRMVLDGVVDPAESWDATNEEQAKGFETNLRAYLSWCLTTDKKNCPFRGSTVDASMQTIGGLLQKVDAHPIRNSDGRMLGSATFVTAIITPLYSTSNWSALDALFQDVMNGSARVAFLLADSYNDIGTDGKFTDNLMAAFQAVSCLDYPMDTDPAALRAEATRMAQLAPIIGPYMSYAGVYCAGWPVGPPAPRTAISAAGSAPILVVGTTGDPATPYANAQRVANDELQNGHLVTWHGDGHTAYGRSNSCVTNAVDSYLIDGTVPASDPQC